MKRIKKRKKDLISVPYPSKKKKKNPVLVWNIDNINKIRKLGLKTSGRAILFSQLTKLEKKGKEKKLERVTSNLS